MIKSLLILIAIIFCLDAIYKKHAFISNPEIKTLDKRAKVYLPESNFKTDVLAIEKLLWKIPYKNNVDIILNEETEKVLSQFYDVVSHDQSQLKHIEMRKFISQTMSIQDALKLNSLLKSYFNYKNALNDALKKIEHLKNTNKSNYLKTYNSETIRLQKVFFDTDVAEDLFHKKNTLMLYINNKQIIRLDSEIKGLEKENKLQSLKDSYHNSVKEYR